MVPFWIFTTVLVNVRIYSLISGKYSTHLNKNYLLFGKKMFIHLNQWLYLEIRKQTHLVDFIHIIQWIQAESNTHETWDADIGRIVQKYAPNKKWWKQTQAPPRSSNDKGQFIFVIVQ